MDFAFWSQRNFALARVRILVPQQEDGIIYSFIVEDQPDFERYREIIGLCLPVVQVVNDGHHLVVTLAEHFFNNVPHFPVS